MEIIVNILFLLLEFPVRFQTREIPSLGTMEIYQNNTWEKLCSASWDDVEENLTCKAMGYFNNGLNDNGTWYKDIHASNTTIHHNCTSLTHNCMNNSKEKIQSCKGIRPSYIRYRNIAMKSSKYRIIESKVRLAIILRTDCINL